MNREFVTNWTWQVKKGTLAFLVLANHRKRVKNIYSTLSGFDLKWLNILLISVTCVIILNSLIEWTKNYFSFMPSDLVYLT